MDDIDIFAAVHPSSPTPALEPEVVEETLPALPDFDIQPVAALLVRFEQEVTLMVQQAQTIMVIKDSATNQQATGWALKVKDLNKQLEGLRQHFVAPHNKFVKAVNNFFKRYQEPLTDIEKSLGRKISAFRQLQENERRRQEAEAREEARKLEEKLKAEAKEAEAQGIEYQPVSVVAPVIPEVAKVTRTEEGSASQRKAWTFEITDEAQIPREYLQVDEKKIRQAIKAGVREIPGVRIFEDLTTMFRV